METPERTALLRGKQSEAKKRRANLWQTYQEPVLDLRGKPGRFFGTVSEVISGDLVVVAFEGAPKDASKAKQVTAPRSSSGDKIKKIIERQSNLRKVYLSSTRAPRRGTVSFRHVCDCFAFRFVAFLCFALLCRRDDATRRGWDVNERKNE